MSSSWPVAIAGGWVACCGASALGYRWYAHNFPWVEVEYETETEFARDKRRTERYFHLAGCAVGFGVLTLIGIGALNYHY